MEFPARRPVSRLAQDSVMSGFSYFRIQLREAQAHRIVDPHPREMVTAKKDYFARPVLLGFSPARFLSVGGKQALVTEAFRQS